MNSSGKWLEIFAIELQIYVLTKQCFQKYYIFSDHLTILTAQAKVKDVTEYGGDEIVTEHMMPLYGGVGNVIKSLTIHGKHDTMMDYSLKTDHKGEFGYIIF